MWYLIELGGERYTPFFSEETPDCPASGRLVEFASEEEALYYQETGRYPDSE